MKKTILKTSALATALVGAAYSRAVTIEQINANRGAEPLRRQAAVRNIDEEARTVEVAFSSEEPVQRWFGDEILDHSEGAMLQERLGNGAAVLWNHNTDVQIGVVESASVDTDRRGRAVLRFGNSARAAEIWADTLGDGVAKTADTLNIGIEELQELRYAAERAGVATSSFDTAMEKMTKNIGLAMEGTGAQKDALDLLGLSALDLAEMLPEEALGLIADRLQSIETQAGKAAIANDLFGRSGIGMLNMLRDGSKGLELMRKEAQKTGYVLSEEAARDAEVFQDTLLDTQLVMKGLKNTVGAELLPVITQNMREIGDFLVTNRKDVKVWAKTFADGVGRAIPVVGEIVKGIGQISKVVWSVTETTAQMVGGWENFGIVIGAVLASGTILKVLKFGAAVFSMGKAMLALAVSLNPIGIAIAAVAGGALLIYKNWGTVGPWFKQMWGNVKTYFRGFGTFLLGVFTGDLGRAWSGIKTMWSGAEGFFRGIWDAVAAVFTGVWNRAIKPVTDALGITDPIIRAWENVKAAIGPILEWIGAKFQAAMAMIKPVVESLKWVVNKGKAAGNAVSDALKFTPQRSPGANPRGGRAAPVQKRALGGAFSPGWTLTGEKGPELNFESRAGYVANNRATRHLAAVSARVAALASHGGGQRRTREVAGAVTKHYH